MSLLPVEAFSLSHAAILDGTTGLEEVDGDIYGVNEASLTPNSDEYENEGDDTVMSTWAWLNYAELDVQAGYLPFVLIALLSGEPVTSSGADPADFYEIELWTDRSFNQPSRPVYLRMPAKHSDGSVRQLEGVLYKVQFGPITFDGPAYKDGLKVNYEGKALLSDNDETGTALGSYKAVARLRDVPNSGTFVPTGA
jgi:hypothetical protein